jgi:hypothetical protein
MGLVLLFPCRQCPGRGVMRPACPVRGYPAAVRRGRAHGCVPSARLRNAAMASACCRVRSISSQPLISFSRQTSDRGRKGNCQRIRGRSSASPATVACGRPAGSAAISAVASGLGDARGQKAVVHALARRCRRSWARSPPGCRNRRARRPPPRARSRCRNCAPRQDEASGMRFSGKSSCSLPSGVKAQVVQQEAAIALAPRRRHEPRRDQLIGVDACRRSAPRRGRHGWSSRSCRGPPSSKGRTSVSVPVTPRRRPSRATSGACARRGPLPAAEVAVGGRGAALARRHAGRRSCPRTSNSPHRPSRARPR